MDRPLALSVHLRYQELVTEKRVTIAFTALWLSNILLAFAFMNLPSHNDLVTVTCLTVGLILVTIAYFRIYQVVRYHQNEIHTQNQIQNGQAMQAARVKKSALNAFYVYIVFLVCYAKFICWYSAGGRQFTLTHISSIRRFSIFSFTKSS